MNFIIITLGLVCGILSGESVGSFFAICFLTVAFIGFFIRYALGHKPNINRLCTVLAFGIGVVSVNVALSSGTLTDYVDHYCTLTGRIAEVSKSTDENYRYTLDTRLIQYDNEIQEIKQNIILTSPEQYELNDTITAEGFLKIPNREMNEFGFNPKLFYQAKDIHYKMYSKQCALAEPPIHSYLPSAFAATLRYKISKLVYSVSSGDHAAILDAVLSGNRSGISDELRNTLVRSGSYRFLYTAYFFIFLLTLMIGYFSGKIPRKIRTLILVAAILMIGLLNSDRPAFVKACLYTAAILFVRQKWGYVYRPDLLCAVASAMLLANPLLIYSSSFVISAAAGALLIAFGDPIRKRLTFIKNVRLRSSLAASFICTIGLLPLEAYYFHGIAPYSVLTAFLYLPVNVLIWICFFPAAGLIKLFGSAPVFSQLLSVALFSYEKLPCWIEKLPYAYLYLSTPGVMLSATFAMGVYTLYLKLHQRRYRLGAAATAVLLGFVVIGQIPRLGTVEMTFVNVGQGDGAVVSVPYQGNILIDGGGGNAYSEYNPGESVFVPYLISHGKTKIDAAFISHFHKDHAQGIIAAVKELKVKALFLPDSLEDSDLRKEAEQAAKEAGTEIYYLSGDTRLNFKNGLVVDVYTPDERTRMSEQENDTSLLLNVRYGESNCLFTGDMTGFSEHSLLLKNRVPQADVLKVAHHGSSTSTTPEWVQAVQPDISILSLGEDNTYGFPRQSVMDALQNTTIYRTDRDGDITVIADKEKIKHVCTYR